MIIPFRAGPLGAALTLGLSLAVPASLWAQRGDSTLSSGSGRGTGTGTGAGAGTGSSQPGTGEMTGPGSLRPGMGLGGPRPSMGPPMGRPAGVPGSLPGDLQRRRQGRDDVGDRGLLAPINPPAPPVRGSDTTFGPGSPSRFPNDPARPMDSLPFPLGEGGRSGIDPDRVDELDDELMPRARAIADPAERSLALDRIARSKTSSRKFREAERALEEAGQAALEMTPGLVRDLRIMSIVTHLNLLAAEEVRQGGLNRDEGFDEMTGDLLLAPGEQDEATRRQAADQAAAARRQRIAEGNFWLKSAQYQWRRAAEMAGKLQSANYRSETLSKVVESQANGSMVIANLATRLDPSRGGDSEQGGVLRDLADRSLVWADQHARKIERPAWRDRAKLAIVVAAATSDQYARGLEIARTIPQPEFRCDALVRLAEDQARQGRTREATTTYTEAARAVAAIPLDDPRDVLTGVLIDSLITLGRFDDARASIDLYSDSTHRLIALGAVAQSQGQRGLADQARAWINREAPAEYRAHLLRRVSDGVTLGIDSVRSQVRNR